MPDAAGVNIGNYKGVMLCNRPFAGVAAAAKTSSKATPSFLTGTPAEKIGANVPIMKDTGSQLPTGARSTRRCLDTRNGSMICRRRRTY